MNPENVTLDSNFCQDFAIIDYYNTHKVDGKPEFIKRSVEPMKFKKKMIAVVATLGIFAVAGTAYAAEFKTPADIVSGLTGKTVEEVTAERYAGKTYGTLANEAGELEQFKQEMLEQKKVILDQRVEEGTLTQEQADSFYSRMEENQATCDGTGSAQMGMRGGAGFGMGMQGRGQGSGYGMRGQGLGFGNQF